MKAQNFFKSLWNDQHGQSTTEYILILAVVVMVAMKFKNVFVSKLGTITDKLTTEIDGAADTSR